MPTQMLLEFLRLWQRVGQIVSMVHDVHFHSEILHFAHARYRAAVGFEGESPIVKSPARTFHQHDPEQMKGWTIKGPKTSMRSHFGVQGAVIDSGPAGTGHIRFATKRAMPRASMVNCGLQCFNPLAWSIQDGLRWGVLGAWMRIG